MRGRFGIALNSSLLFLTGGLSVADVQDKWVPKGASFTPTGFSKSGLNLGAALGAGGEFSVADRVSVSLQYLYLPMLERSATLDCPTSCNAKSYKYLLDDAASILRVGVNYHFN
jgi:outer membrane immunogenic protein